jgi:hypothetical protein
MKGSAYLLVFYFIGFSRKLASGKRSETLHD